MVADPLFNNGFFMHDVSDGLMSNLAMYSLQSALECYVKTAADLDYLYNAVNADANLSSEKKDDYHGTQYAVDACNSIVHFQHFMELFLKDILLEVSPLMVYDASRKPLLLYKIVNGETVTETELEDVIYIEFSVAIDRVEQLQSDRKLDSKYNFLSRYFTVLKKINKLRNRIAHRGAFILRHEALDEIFGKHILPFIGDLSVNIPEYSRAFTWKVNIKNANIKPFESIIAEYKLDNPNDLKVYVYKLMADAGMHNKLDYDLYVYFKDYINEKIKEAEEIADAVAKSRQLDVKECPVCGCKTLIENVETQDEEDCEGNITDVWYFVYNVECQQCGFHLNSWLIDKVKDLNLPVPNYYWAEHY